MAEYDLLDLIPYGKEHKVTSGTLCSLLGCSQRSLQAVIAVKRDEGACICAETDPSDPGYYQAATQQEWDDYVDVVRYMGDDYYRRADQYATYRVEGDGDFAVPKGQGRRHRGDEIREALDDQLTISANPDNGGNCDGHQEGDGITIDHAD